MKTEFRLLSAGDESPISTLCVNLFHNLITLYEEKII
jgi:hypothetical protein